MYGGPTLIDAHAHHRLPIAIALTALVVSTPASGQQRALSMRTTGPLRVGYPLELLDLLARQDVRSELELISDQLDQLTKLQRASRRMLRERFVTLRVGGVEGVRERIRQMSTELRRQLDDSLSQILLPHQMQRLRQLQIQHRLRGGRAEVLLSAEVAKRLGITEDQERALRQKGRQLEIELERQVSAWRAAAQKQLMAVLTSDQREKLGELIGQPFRFDDEPSVGRNQPRVEQQDLQQE